MLKQMMCVVVVATSLLAAESPAAAQMAKSKAPAPVTTWQIDPTH